MSGDVKAIVCADYFPSAEATPAIEAQSLSQMAKGMQGSKILQIAYAVQARIKLEHGRLQWSDLPLVFALDAALAKVAMATCGRSLDPALMSSTLLTYRVAPPAGARLHVAATVCRRGGGRNRE